MADWLKPSEYVPLNIFKFPSFNQLWHFYSNESLANCTVNINKYSLKSKQSSLLLGKLMLSCNELGSGEKGHWVNLAQLLICVNKSWKMQTDSCHWRTSGSLQRRAARRLRRSLEMKRENEGRRESEEVYSGTPEEALAYQSHSGYKTQGCNCQEQRSEGVMQHNNGFTIAQLMFPYWTL